MSRQIQIRRGSATENNAFTGAIGEVTMDTTNKTLRVHDGETTGGTILAKKSEIPDLTNADYVVESQMPNANNNYTWYRKYKSGWLEQGGMYSFTGVHGQNSTINLPETYNNSYYHILRGGSFSYETTSLVDISVVSKAANSFTIQYCSQTGGSYPVDFYWYVCGQAS